VLTGLSPARAGSGPSTPIEVSYTAYRTCPSYEQFIANVRRYTKKWRLAEGEAAAQRFRVVVEPAGADVTSGRLEITETGKPRSVREIAGPDCEAVARALAIALAVVIDPEADLSGGAAEPEAERAPSEPPVERSEEPPRPAAPREHRAVPPSRPPPARATEVRIRLEASFGLTSAVVVGVVPVLGANVELEPFARRRAIESSLPRWLSPSLVLGVRQSLSKELERSTMTSTFVWSAGTLQLCPVRWAAFERMELAPCFELNAGMLRASARGSNDAGSSTKPWFDLGGTARVTWRLDGGWFVGGTFSVIAPVTRYRFELATEASVSQAPPVGIAFGPCGGWGF